MEYKKKILPIVIAVLVVASLAAVIMPASAPSSDTGSECSSCADTSPPQAPAPYTPEESEAECQSCAGLTSGSPLLSALGGGDPGAGCIANTTSYGTIKGGVYLEQQGWSDSSPMTKTFNNVPSNIKLAKVFTGIWQGGPGKGGFFNITIQNATGSYTTATYQACDPCPSAPCAAYQSQRCDALNWSGNLDHNQPLDRANMHDYIVGCGVHFISFNATPYITPGTNTITVRNSCCPNCTCWDGRIYLIALLVVYENSSMPEITYWVNEGALYLENGSFCDGPEDHLYASKYFNGSHVTNCTKVKLWSLGWPHVINTSDSAGGWTKLNDCNLSSPDITESYASGYNEVLLRWDNISCSCLNDTSNFLQYYDPEPFYERAFVEVLIAQGPTGPDLTVTDIEFPTVMRPNKTYTITAMVKNQGGQNAGAFNVSLKAERGGTIYYNSTRTVEGLPAGKTTPVNFTDVNLSEGCYNFTAKADCDDNVSEANENNNERTECYQVDYVIVVDNNSDFDALVAEGLATKVGDTYYIQNLTITNCAGSGITIRNTNVPFVIRNCTVHNCSDHGMEFWRVTNGKVNGSEIRNCGLKGIKMYNCSYITIDNNYVHDNADYGIDVYMEIMPYLDSHHITITNNTLVRNMYGVELMGLNCTVRDNVILNSTARAGGGGYGIYVAGNNSKIYNNTIKYSDNYGIKVDNDWPSIPTYWNCIFGNNFIENNRSISHTSQAYDSGINYWNTTRKIGYYYNGTDPSFAHDNHTGNYWNDYTGGDPDGDGIGNVPHGIDGGTNKDYSPLMKPWQNYSLIKCGDVNCDDDVTGYDVTVLKLYVGKVPGWSPKSMWASDVNCDGDGDVTGYDVTVLKLYVGKVPGWKLSCCAGCGC